MPSSGDRAGRPLGRRQAEVLGAIEAYVRRHDRPPTVREIGHDAGIASTGHVAHVLAALERRGYLTCERGVARGIHLTRAPGVPVLGTIAAGVPLDLFDAGPPELLDLAAHVRGGAASAPAGAGDAAGSEFALLVRGDSMIEDGILDGDYVLVRRAATAPEGAIVVAVHLASAGGEQGAATLKRLFLDRRRARVLLCPANAALQPLEIAAAEWAREWQVQGIVTALYRPHGIAAATRAPRASRHSRS
jgi:repressor LexA